MIEIKDLLQRFSKILLSERNKKDFIVETINKEAKINIKSEDIELKGESIYLKIKPIYKNQVFIKKEVILNEIEKSVGKKIYKNIF